MNDVATEESEISDYIEDYRDLDISFDTMHLKETSTFTDNSKTRKIMLLGDALTTKYKNDLAELEETKVLSAEEQSKYMCNPWALSYDLYGSVEYWHLLLEVNHMFSITEFTQSTIKIYDQTLPDVIDAILALEEEFINNNAEELNDSFTSAISEDDISDTDDDNDIDESEDDDVDDSDDE